VLSLGNKFVGAIGFAFLFCTVCWFCGWTIGTF
jgi:hypothetical protein